MNNKGFTLVEVLSVIVILSLIITIVATNGFGAFDSSKTKISEINEAAILDAANLLKIDMENCDDDVSGDLLKGLLGDGKSCNDLNKTLSSGININYNVLAKLNYLTEEDISENVTFKFNYKRSDSNSPITLNPTRLEGYAKLSNINRFLKQILSDLALNSNEVEEIHFVDYVTKKEYEVKTEKDESNTSVYAWRDDVNDKILYIGSEGNIYASSTLTNVFKNFTNLTNVTFENFDTSKTILLNSLFENCTSLVEIDLTSLDVSSVKSMNKMFLGCTKLKKIILNNYTSANVQAMTEMFKGCKSLETLDLSNFNTSSLRLMSNMFDGCESLEKLDLSNFNTNKVEKMNNLFANCTNLQELHIDNFNTTSLEQYSDIFFGTNPSTIYVDKDKVEKIYSQIENTGATIIKS